MTVWDSNSGLLCAGCVLWPSHSTSLSLGLSICQMGRLIVPNAYVGVRVKGSGDVTFTSAWHIVNFQEVVIII